MKTPRILCLATLSFWVAFGSAQAMNTPAVNEIVKLRNAGLADDTIVAYVQSKNLNYDLSADDTISLRQQQGISQAVLNAMLISGGAPLVPAPAAPAPAGQPLFAQPQPTTPAPVITQSGAAVDDAYFRQELSPYGNWMLAEDNQWYWQPTILATKRDWRPYWDQGHWVNTDHGWYWASDYPWGWAVFHYGRWQLHPHHGWIWYPDRVWGPAWVTWRNGGDYCGWAPLPPHANYDSISGAFSFYGRHVEVGFDFGLDWNHFNFTLVREMGDQPRSHFRREEDLRRVYNQTTIVNNYSVIRDQNRNSFGNAELHPHIVNRGIDPERVAAARGRPVETLQIQDLRAPTGTRAHEQFNSEAKTLNVYRPALSGPPPARAQPGRPGPSGNQNGDFDRKQPR